MFKTILTAAATLALIATPAHARERNREKDNSGEIVLSVIAGALIGAAIAKGDDIKRERRYEDYASRRRNYYYYVPRAPRRGYYSPEEYERYNYGYQECFSERRVDNRGYSYYVEVCR